MHLNDADVKLRAAEAIWKDATPEVCSDAWWVAVTGTGSFISFILWACKEECDND